MIVVEGIIRRIGPMLKGYFFNIVRISDMVLRVLGFLEAGPNHTKCRFLCGFDELLRS